MYNKENPNYKLYLAGIITENQYYNLIEQSGQGFAYAGKGILIPSEHGSEAGSTRIEPPIDQTAREYAKSICEKYGYWYEGKGEEGNKGNGPEMNYCISLGVKNPKNNGSYDDFVTMTGYFNGVPTFSSVEANWEDNSPKIDFQNSRTIADALRSALANGAGTFARNNVNMKLNESEIEQIFAVVRQDFPEFEKQEFKTQNKAEEFKLWMLQAENAMWETKGTALSKIGDAAEKEREIQIVNIVKTKGGLFFLGKDHFPRLVGVSWSTPQQIGAMTQQTGTMPQQLIK